MEWGLLLLLLICPIMMIFMMKGHNHGGHHKQGLHQNHFNSDQDNPSRQCSR